MNLVKMTIFHLKRLLMPLILFMMIGMPVLINGIMLTTQRKVDTKVPKYGRKTNLPLYSTRKWEVRRIDCALYPRRECVLRFRWRQEA